MRAAGEQTIRVQVLMDGLVVGGMSYRLDPDVKRAPIEMAGAPLVALDDPRIEELLADRDANQPDDLDGGDRGLLPVADSPAAPESSSDLLARLGLAEGLTGARRVTVRETTVHIELDRGVKQTRSTSRGECPDLTHAMGRIRAFDGW